jgi:tetratricopeptide (TPR) repeat protein
MLSSSVFLGVHSESAKQAWWFYLGRPDEGHRHLLRAELLDPTLPRIKKNLGHVFYAKRQFERAIEEYRKAIVLEPNYPVARDFISRSYLALGNYEKGIEEFGLWRLAKGEDSAQVALDCAALRQAYEASGARGYWLKRLELATTSEGEPHPYFLGKCHAHLGDLGSAVDWLEKFYALHSAGTLGYLDLIFDDCWDPFRADPRFIAFARKVGLAK